MVFSPNNPVNSGSGETTKSFEISPGTQVHSIERIATFFTKGYLDLSW